MSSSPSLKRKNSAKGSVSPGISKPIAKKTPEVVDHNATVRKKVREMLLAAVYRPEEEFVDDELKASEVVSELEQAMFKKYNGTTAAYKDKYRSFSFNMKDQKNSYLRKRVLKRDTTAERLLDMSPLELASEEKKEMAEKIQANNLREAQAFDPNKQAATTDAFKCGNCKQRKCTYYQMQTRSADEPITTFVTCTVCKKRWKC